jgi:uncharacterized protein (DUF849 family)
VHPRGEDGEETLAPGVCCEAVAAIRAAAPQIEVSLTTREAAEPDLERRVHAVHHWTVVPDVASLNVFEPGFEELGTALANRGIAIEAGLMTVGDAERFLRSRLVRHCKRVLVEVQEAEPQAAVAAAAAIDEALQDRFLVLPQLHHGEGRATWAVLVAASRAGRDVRIGLEDTLVMPDGATAPDNAALVAAVSQTR